MVFISVIIATYNRVKSLKEVVSDLLAQEVPSEIKYEIIVVDNNSSDGTMDYLKDHASRDERLRWAVEKRQGQAHALNTGVSFAQGDIIALTDDDVEIKTNWLAVMGKTFKANPDVDCITGRVLPIWGGKRAPDWYSEQMSSVLGMKDHGAQVKSVKHCIGANAGYRVSLIKEIGDFNANSRFPDAEYSRRLLRKGYEIKYYPALTVNHQVQESRLDKSYFQRWYSLAGELEAKLMEPNIKRQVFGAELWRWREAMTHLFSSIFNFFNKKESTYHYFLWIYFLAFLNERRGLQR